MWITAKTDSVVLTMSANEVQLVASNFPPKTQTRDQNRNQTVSTKVLMITPTEVKMASPSHNTTAKLPSWIRDGKLVSKTLKSVVSSHTKNLDSSKSEEQREGADRLYELIKSVWSLDTHLARDAADLVCDELRWVYIHIILWIGTTAF